jgi:hypothetical protein
LGLTCFEGVVLVVAPPRAGHGSSASRDAELHVPFGQLAEGDVTERLQVIREHRNEHVADLARAVEIDPMLLAVAALC